MNFLFIGTTAVTSHWYDLNSFLTHHIEAESNNDAIEFCSQFVINQDAAIVGLLLRLDKGLATRVATCFTIIQKFSDGRQTHYGEAKSFVVTETEEIIALAEKMENIYRNIVYGPSWQDRDEHSQAQTSRFSVISQSCQNPFT